MAKKKPTPTSDPKHIHGIKACLQPSTEPSTTTQSATQPLENTPATILKADDREQEETHSETVGKPEETQVKHTSEVGNTEPKAEQPAGEVQLKHTSEVGVGSAVDESSSASTESHTRESRAQATNRWILEGRKLEVETFRDEVRKSCQKRGMSKYDSNEHAWTAALEAFPPPGVTPQVAPSPVDPPAAAEPEVAGVYLVPSEWPPLGDNASLQAELGWVQSQRLAIVETRGNSTIVHLQRASCPAPSKAALAWLETSIRSYAKYLDVVSRVLVGAQDEQDNVRRERMRLADIDALLAEMCDDEAGRR